MLVSIGKIKFKFMNNTLFKIWREAETSIDYVIALWITLLFCTATVGLLSILFLLATQPERFSNISFGLIDFI